MKCAALPLSIRLFRLRANGEYFPLGDEDLDAKIIRDR
jgi:hypothetical protein